MVGLGVSVSADVTVFINARADGSVDEVVAQRAGLGGDGGGIEPDDIPLHTTFEISPRSVLPLGEPGA